MTDEAQYDTPTDSPGEADHEANAAEREKLLHEIFMRQARAIASILKHTPPEKLRASMVQAITQWCRLNGLSNDSLPDAGKADREGAALAQQIKALTPPSDGPPVGYADPEVDEVVREAGDR